VADKRQQPSRKPAVKESQANASETHKE